MCFRLVLTSITLNDLERRNYRRVSTVSAVSELLVYMLNLVCMVDAASTLVVRKKLNKVHCVGAAL